MSVAVANPWSVPDARQLLSVDAPVEAWLAERRKGLGGSDASAVAGISQWTTPYELWLDKTGRGAPKDETRSMELGRMLEPIARTLFMQDTGIRVRRAGLMQSREHPLMRVSLDGLTEDGGIYEGKATTWRLAHEWSDDQVSDHAELQVQHGLAVTGRSHAWVTALIGHDLLVRRVERNDDLINDLIDIEHAFWSEHVEADVAPPVSARALSAVKSRWSDIGRPFVVLDPDTWAELADALRDAKVAVKDAEADRDLADARLREVIADAEVVRVGDLEVATCKRTSSGKRIDPKALRAAHPDIAAAFEREGFYRRLTVLAKPRPIIEKDED